MTTPLTFHQCCQKIVDAAAAGRGDLRRLGTALLLDYAAGYAEVGLRLKEGSMEAKIQALYIVENLKAWRAPEAAAIRTRLRELAK